MSCRKLLPLAAAADARQLPGSGPASAVNTDAAAPVNTSPDAHFRD